MTARILLVTLDQDDCQHASILLGIGGRSVVNDVPCFTATIVPAGQPATVETVSLLCFKDGFADAIAAIAAEQADAGSQASFIVRVYELRGESVPDPCEVVEIERVEGGAALEGFDAEWSELQADRQKAA